MITFQEAVSLSVHKEDQHKTIRANQGGFLDTKILEILMGQNFSEGEGFIR